jgi:hypothetical protein
MIVASEGGYPLRVGTKSVLFGAHQFLLHPFFVAWGWMRLYGFPRDVRIWFAFFLHDIGYIGKENMDGPEGETHPELGAAVMGRLFGKEWGDFTLAHSRSYAKLRGIERSKLCYADKMASVLIPLWLYLVLITLSGEVHEYIRNCNESGFYLGTDKIGWAKVVRAHWKEKYDRGTPSALGLTNNL